ncbi:MAG: hypothetical protein JSR46_07160 [Verrucomicrobia bacterium]|nr:hypothetical protein [Verrucomicrobiota bacterium]
MRKLCVLLLLCTAVLRADSNYPADVSFFIADLKYSQEHGVKICEIQQGVLSIFFGDVLLNGKNGLISSQVEQVFAEFPIKKWSINSDITFNSLLAELMESPRWNFHRSSSELFSDPAFLKAAATPPKDPNSIASYKGMVLARSSTIGDYKEFRKKYPGIMVAGAPSFSCWIDKYKMSLLFARDPIVAAVKPEWGLYPKIYSETLAQTIMNDIPSERYVIKPRGAFLGAGVIIVPKEELDSTLQYILQPSTALLANRDKSYSYWNHERFDSFLVEKYYPSDEISVDAFGGKTYEPTMRAAFMLIYDNKKIDFRFLWGYWLLPEKSLEEGGTLNEVAKAYCKLPFFTPASDEVLRQVTKQLGATMPALYKYMLES